VALYLLGCALMFQIPLIMLLINRIKPIGPSKLLKYERHVIVGSVIVAFIMNPSPNLMSQLLVVIPILGSYQLSILLLWIVQRRGRPTHLDLLRNQDTERQAERTHRGLEPLDEPLLTSEPALVALAETEEDLSVPVRVIKTAPKIEPVLELADAEVATAPAEPEFETIPVRIATVRRVRPSHISVATSIEVFNRSRHAAAQRPEPAPITYTPSDDGAERIDVRVVRPRPIDLSNRSFIPSLRSQLIQ